MVFHLFSPSFSSSSMHHRYLWPLVFSSGVAAVSALLWPLLLDWSTSNESGSQQDIPNFSRTRPPFSSRSTRNELPSFLALVIAVCRRILSSSSFLFRSLRFWLSRTIYSYVEIPSFWSLRWKTSSCRISDKDTTSKNKKVPMIATEGIVVPTENQSDALSFDPQKSTYMSTISTICMIDWTSSMRLMEIMVRKKYL